MNTRAMCSGFGQFHTNEDDPVKPNKKLTPYESITLDEVIELVSDPAKVDKSQGRWLIPSTLLSRTFKEQEANGNYLLLWADLDKQPPGMDDLLAIVVRVVGAGTQFLLYNSRSATPDNQKARLLIPLAAPLSGADWLICQTILNDGLEGLKVVPDRVSEGAAQLCYLPNRGELYDYRIKGTKPFSPLTTWADQIQNKRDVLRLEEEASKQRQEQASIRRKQRQFNTKATPINAFNLAYTVEEVLTGYGYDQRGNNFRHPASESGSYSASVKDGRVYSLSQNDPLYTANDSNGSHDAFSAFCVLHHGGDQKKAVRAAAELLGMNQPSSDSGGNDNGLMDAREIVRRVIESVASDDSAPFTDEAIAALTLLRARAPIEYERARAAIKKANPSVRVGAMDSLTKEAAEDADSASIATKLSDLAASRCALWHDKDGNAYASLEKEHAGSNHLEHWRIESASFREWLSWLAHVELGSAPASEAIKSVCNALTGKAKFDGEEHTAHLRVAEHDGGIWIDLIDERWQAVFVTATGWKIMDKPGCRFIRNRSMRALPTPVEGGSIDGLWQIVNIPAEDRPLILAWMLESFRPGTPYPVLELIGEQGSAKSTTQSTLRHFIDPNKVMLRGKPKGVDDLFVAAGANHIVSLENLSGISSEISDALCTISTGGGTSGRQLYTNNEESIIEAHNPIILNGIGAIVTRPDLLDRTIALCLPTITHRITESKHLTMVEANEGAIMGGLLSLLANTLAKLPAVRIPQDETPRMADFSQLGEAMHLANGNKPGEWLALYEEHRRDAIRRTIDSNPVAAECINHIEKRGAFDGTVKGLLEAFNRGADVAKLLEHGDYWPKTPKGLADQLRRVAPALRQIGITLALERKPRRDGVHVRLQKTDTFSTSQGANNRKTSSPSSPSSHKPPEKDEFEEFRV